NVLTNADWWRIRHAPPGATDDPVGNVSGGRNVLVMRIGCSFRQASPGATDDPCRERLWGQKAWRVGGAKCVEKSLDAAGRSACATSAERIISNLAAAFWRVGTRQARVLESPGAGQRLE